MSWLSPPRFRELTVRMFTRSKCLFRRSLNIIEKVNGTGSPELATVLNKGGGIVRDLTKDDFVLAENGRPQTIRYFSRETDLPRHARHVDDAAVSPSRHLRG